MIQDKRYYIDIDPNGGESVSFRVGSPEGELSQIKRTMKQLLEAVWRIEAALIKETENDRRR